MANTPLTVSELTARIKQVLEQGFTRLEITGEISRLTTPSSGHMYFTIKDNHAAISAVVWRSAAARLNIRPKDGQAYIFKGHLSLYEPRGSYQLVVTSILAAGEGQLAAEFERRKALFANKGWFDNASKQTIPQYPKHIGIVTSQTAAAFEDVKKVLHTRPAWLNITLSPAVVQGESAPKSIFQAIRRLHQLEDKPDVILLVRGGGSIEDLWCFNDEKVVQAIFASNIPIISGVGHEIDTTLADLAADIRAATPSNAAEIVCPAKDTLKPQVSRLYQHLTQALNSLKDAKYWALERVNHQFQQHIRQSMKKKHFQVRELKNRLQQFEPNHRLRQDMHQFYSLKQRLFAVTQNTVPKKRHALEQAAYQLRLSYEHQLQHNYHQWQKRHEQLLAMNPTHVLKRGYAITTNAKGEVISSIRKLAKGDTVHLHLHDGTAATQVTHVKRKTP
ncbi:MAG: exodeoxyribonuclease VII large subunit [Ghiorsea sp.]|nr:exodeoxyribonuclease VII large subunit [Ghiorsea sp.]